MVSSMSTDIDEPLCKGISTSTAFWGIWAAATGRSTATSAQAAEQRGSSGESRRRPRAWTADHYGLSGLAVAWAWISSLVCAERESKGSRAEIARPAPYEFPFRKPRVGWPWWAGCRSPFQLSSTPKTPKPSSPPAPVTEPGQTPCVQEVGGRLVVCGEAVVVTANPDEPLRDSSIATKIETPLLETPRSVSIIDRRTLDDMGAVNITQAHDYAVGLTLLDERGPGVRPRVSSRRSTICDATGCEPFRGAFANRSQSTASSTFADLPRCCMETAVPGPSSTWC